MGDQPVARPLPTHRTTQNKRAYASISPMWFESTTTAFEGVETVDASDRAVTEFGKYENTYILQHSWRTIIASPVLDVRLDMKSRLYLLQAVREHLLMSPLIWLEVFVHSFGWLVWRYLTMGIAIIKLQPTTALRMARWLTYRNYSCSCLTIRPKDIGTGFEAPITHPAASLTDQPTVESQWHYQSWYIKSHSTKNCIMLISVVN
jgi:hypothetical protein